MKLFRHWWLKSLAVIGALVLLAALGFFNGALQAKNGAERYRAELRSRGETLELLKLVPPRLPPESNGAVTLASVSARLKALPPDVLTTNSLAGLMVAPGTMLVVWREPVWGDHKWATNSWQEVAAAVAKREPYFELLRQLAPDVRMDFQLDYTALARTPLVHLADCKSVVQQLTSMAIYHLHAGEDSKAVRDLDLVLTLIASSDDDRVLISELVRFAITSIAASATFQILQSDRVSEAGLREHQARWQRLQFIAPLEHAFKMERTVVPDMIAEMRASTGAVRNAWGTWTSSSPSSPAGLIDELKDLGDSVRGGASELVWRASWSYSDERRSMETAHLCVEACRRISTNGAFKPGLDWLAGELKTRGLNDSANAGWLRSKLDRDLWEMFNMEGGLSKSLERALQAETTRAIVIAAIALKRFHLRHGQHPETLDALVPEFLSDVPKDPVDGKPLRYRRTSDGLFRLYSVGQNGTDEGGSTAGGAKNLWWLRANDWVWPQPATEAEAEARRNSKR